MLVNIAHMIGMIMGNHHIIDTFPVGFRCEVADIFGNHLRGSDRAVRLRVCRHIFMLLEKRPGAIYKHGRPIREHIEHTLAAACIDRMDVKISLFPWRDMILVFTRD